MSNTTVDYTKLRQMVISTRNEMAAANQKDEGGILVIPNKDTWKATQLMAEHPYATLGAGVAVGVATTTMGARGVFGEGVQNLILGK